MDWMCEGEERLYVADIGLALLGLVIAGSVGQLPVLQFFIRKTNSIKRTTKAVLHNDAGRLSA